MLGGCFGPSVTRCFRVIATVDVDGKEVEGSTVMGGTHIPEPSNDESAGKKLPCSD
jgi:hypothetical protein